MQEEMRLKCSIFSKVNENESLKHNNSRSRVIFLLQENVSNFLEFFERSKIERHWQIYQFSIVYHSLALIVHRRIASLLS